MTTTNTQEQVFSAPDAFRFETVEVYGRTVAPTKVRVFEMDIGDIADCTQEMLQIAAAFYANRDRVQALKATAEAEKREVTAQDVIKAVDLRTITTAVANALFIVASKATGETPEFIRSLHPAAFINVAAAVLAMNSPFFLTLPTLFGLGGKTEEAPAQESAKEPVAL